MTKKIVFWISGIITLLVIILNQIGTYKLCGVGVSSTFFSSFFSLFNKSCVDPLANLIIIFIIFIPLFLLSLITYKMRNEIFRAWLKFAYVWIPLTLVLTILAPEYDQSLLPITKGVVSFLMSVLFLIISFLIILIKYFSLRQKT